MSDPTPAELLDKAQALGEAAEILAEQSQALAELARELLATGQALQETAAGMRTWPLQPEAPKD